MLSRDGGWRVWKSDTWLAIA